MDFNKLKNQDILRITRKGDFSDILNAYQTLEYHGEELDDFSENKTTALLLESEPLQLWEVEAFAKAYNLVDTESYCSTYFESQYFEDGNIFNQSSDELRIEFKNFLDSLKSAGELHQLQYDNYKYVREWGD